MSEIPLVHDSDYHGDQSDTDSNRSIDVEPYFIDYDLMDHIQERGGVIAAQEQVDDIAPIRRNDNRNISESSSDHHIWDTDEFEEMTREFNMSPEEYAKYEQQLANQPHHPHNSSLLKNPPNEQSSLASKRSVCSELSPAESKYPSQLQSSSDHTGDEGETNKSDGDDLDISHSTSKSNKDGNQSPANGNSIGKSQSSKSGTNEHYSEGSDDEIPSWVGGPLDRNLILSLTERLGLAPFQSFRSWATELDVYGDGNCFYYSSILALFCQRRQPIYPHRGTPDEIVNHLKIQLCSVTDFRKELFNYWSDNHLHFISKDVNVRRVHQGAGGCYYNDNVANNIVGEGGIGRNLYIPGTDYSNGCRYDQWGDLNNNIPIVALKWEITFVVYFVMNVFGVAHPYTFVAEYLNDNVKVLRLKGYHSCNSDKSVCCLRYVNGNHFVYLHPHNSLVHIPRDIGTTFKEYGGIAAPPLVTRWIRLSILDR